MVTDLWGGLERIVKLTIAIKEAVKNADLNMKYCHMMDNLVDTVRTIVNEEDRNFREDERNALSVTMNRLEVALKKACECIGKCREQDKMSFRRALKAADTAKELQHIRIEISSCISMLQLAESFRLSTSLRNIEQGQRDIKQTLGLILQLLVFGSDDVPQEQEVARSVQTSSIRDSSVVIITRSGNESKRSKAKVLARGKEPSDFLAAAGLQKYSLGELQVATKSFKPEEIIGEGAGGVIYKGKLNQVEVAIRDHYLMMDFDSEVMEFDSKVMEFNSEVMNFDFDVKALDKEFRLLSTLKHKNIIEFLGCHLPAMRRHIRPRKEDKFISVTKYMPQGSLARIIEDNKKQKRIGWTSLFQIIQGIAEGVRYLHDQLIVHLDLKPSHILIDSDMTPKINDFRKARVLDDDVDFITLEWKNPTTPGSSKAYTAPEQENGTASTKSDVFSFGVIVIATLTSMCKSKILRLVSSDPDPKEWLIRLQHNDWMDIFDETRVTDGFEQTMARWLLPVGLMCCVPDPANRPSMSEVIDMLLAARDTPWHEILTRDELRTLMQQDTSRIANALNVPFGVAERLLLRFHWTPETVKDKWSLNRDAACRDIGLRSSGDRAMKLDQGFGICGLFCYKDLCNRKSTGSCDHYFCEACWRRYMSREVKRQGQMCLQLQCPDGNCEAPVVREMFEGIANAWDMKWYDKYAQESYVLNRGMIRLCPGPDCDYAIRFHGCVGNVGVDVVCDRNHSSHWRCDRKHQPEKQCQMEVGA